MNKLTAKLITLLEVRKLITFVIVLVFVIMSLSGSLNVNFIENVILMTVSYYFAKSTALDNNK